MAIARAPVALADGTPARSILLVTVANTPGSLHRLLGPFAEYGLNLSKLESRPTGEPWSYRFIVEVEHSAGAPAMAAALTAIRGMVESFRVVGTYAIGAYDAADPSRRASSVRTSSRETPTARSATRV
ncbi:MAG: ACT domain-containing protein [Gemmatimonadaceae bacterium]